MAFAGKTSRLVTIDNFGGEKSRRRTRQAARWPAQLLLGIADANATQASVCAVVNGTPGISISKWCTSFDAYVPNFESSLPRRCHQVMFIPADMACPICQHATDDDDDDDGRFGSILLVGHFVN